MEETKLMTPAPTQEQTNNTDDERLLGDLTFAQVLSGALAAATSFTLSKQIGIAGSLIGAAVGAAASAVAGQFYKSLIKKSAHKLESLKHTGEEAPVSEKPAETELTAVAPAAEPAPEAEPESTPETPLHQRRWAIVAALLAAALLAVGIYAAVVTLATNGEGIGDKPQIIYVVVEQPDDETADSPEKEETPEQTNTPEPPEPSDEETPADTPADEPAPTDEPTVEPEPGTDPTTPTTDDQTPTDPSTNPVDPETTPSVPETPVTQP